MATLPNASVTLDTSGGAVGVSGTNLLCIISTSEKGPINTPQIHASSAGLISAFGRGEGTELAAHHLEVNRQVVCFIRATSATAGTISHSDETGVTGTSNVTFSGTPFDDEEIKVLVVAGGTIGTAGITIKTSRDGGLTYSGAIRLGTSTSYAIPGTGVTVNFAAGTLVAGDYATAYCVSPKWDAAGLGLAFDALAASVYLPRTIVVCGDVDTGGELQAVIDEINGYETTANRYARVVCSARDQYRPAVAQGGLAVSAVSGTPDSYTRASGSFVADGFQVGMQITVSGFSTAANNGTKTVTAVTALALEIAELDVVSEPTVSGVSIVGVEPKSTWRTAVEALIGTTPATAKTSHRTILRAGRARRKSPLDGSQKRRPSAWPYVVRQMGHAPHISPAKVDLGPLSGWSIVDEAGVLAEHDERVDGGLLAIRTGCLRTHDDLSGVFDALPVTLAADNTALSRHPVGAVMDIACTIAKRETQRKLNSEILVNSNGTIQEAEAKRIEGVVLSQLRAALLSAGPEGQLASDVTFTISRSVNLLSPGAIVPCEVVVTPLGYLEQIATTVRVNVGV